MCGFNGGMTNTWVMGGTQTDFARNWTKEGGDFADLFAEIVQGALASSGVAPHDIGVIHVGNAFSQRFTGQGHLGAMAATVEPALWGVPATQHEGACAAGGVAVIAAMADLESGRYDCALVLGAELEKTVPGDEAAAAINAASWVGHEADGVQFVWPHMFSALADEYDRRYGLDGDHLRAIGELNFRNARSNPNAQTRAWTLTPASFSEDDHANPVVDGWLRQQDCSQITDGGAAVVLVSDRFLADHPHLSVRPRARVMGWGHRTVGLPLDRKLAMSADDPYVFPHVRRAVLDSFERAGTEIDRIDGVETHDCFSMSEYMAIDHLGITPPGDAWKAIEAGDLERDGRMPVNASGGLMGLGHPVGATGVRMLLDAFGQVTAQAGDYQIDGAGTMATLNIGGSTSTVVTFVVGDAQQAAASEGGTAWTSS
jgi:acetyl-CoA C-acetyltransferase